MRLEFVSACAASEAFELYSGYRGALHVSKVKALLSHRHLGSVASAAADPAAVWCRLSAAALWLRPRVGAEDE